MDLEIKNFGKGPRELTGALDLINRFKLLPHFDFFCKKSLPMSISEAHYLKNIVGDSEVRKGDGMQLDQLIQNTSYSGNSNVRIKPFDLDVLGDAFQLKETYPVELPSVEKGIPTVVAKPKSEFKDKEKRHKKDKDKDKEQKKHKHHHKDRSKDRDKEKKKDSYAIPDSGIDRLKKVHDKKRKYDGDADLNGMHTHAKSKKSSKRSEKNGMKGAEWYEGRKSTL